MKDDQIKRLYLEIEEKWEEHLKSFDVKLPKLYSANKAFTINALVLTYLYSNLGKIVSKKTLTQFLKDRGIEANDVQQARHLAQQSGWYILSGTRGDIESKKYNLQAGDYLLKTVEEPYPSFSNLKRSSSLTAGSWEEIKKSYHNRCASCGSEEGKPNRYYPATITKLQKGHLDPKKSLDVGNIIPQCSKCNQPDRNYFIYDTFGRVVAIADAKYILKSSEEVQRETLEILLKKFGKR